MKTATEETVSFCDRSGISKPQQIVGADLIETGQLDYDVNRNVPFAGLIAGVACLGTAYAVSDLPLGKVTAAADILDDAVYGVLLADLRKAYPGGFLHGRVGGILKGQPQDKIRADAVIVCQYHNAPQRQQLPSVFVINVADPGAAYKCGYFALGVCPVCPQGADYLGS